MKYIIWGAGDRGERIIYHLNKNEVEAFIDVDENKIGKQYCGKPVIDFGEYKRNYWDCFIIISCLQESEVIELLEKENIYKYFLLTDCPGEFQESYPRGILKEYIQGYLKPEKKYAIYGCTLYSLILSDWIEEKLGAHVDIIPHTSADTQLIGQLQTWNYRFDTIKSLKSKDIDEILLTVETDIKTVEQYKSKKIAIKNVFDCSDDISEYYNPKIEQVKNIHEGKRCFIVATGPSLTMADLNTLWKNQEICISVNDIWRAFENTDWRPQYYIAVDYRALRDDEDVMEKLDIAYLFLGDTYEDYWSRSHKGNLLKHHQVYEHPEERYPKFSHDFARKSYHGFSVTYNAIQLAVYMGFKEIYLIGVDFSYADSKKDEKYGHFYKEDKLTAIGHVKQVTLAYKAAKMYADTHDIKIYNATRGGKLEVFPRVNFDDLFD